MPGVHLVNPGPVFQDPNKNAVHSNATVTATGSMVVAGYGTPEITLFINVKAAPTGTTPTLQYTIQEVDPGDGATAIGATATSTVINAIGIQRISLPGALGGSVKISWVVTGAAASFTQVYATLVGKSSTAKLVDATGVAISAANKLQTDATVTGSATATQGTAAALSGAWPVKVTDGTNTMPTADAAARAVFQKVTDGTNTAAVKAASTAPIATDTALVVAVSPNSGTALDATLTGGTQKAIARGGAKGATVAADVTSTAEGTDHQSMDVQIYHGGTAKDPTAIRALTSADVVTSAQGTAAALSGAWPAKITDGTNTMPTADSAARASFHKITDGTNTQPTGDSITRAIFHKITDGTSTAVILAANTPAAVTDPALVVAISPNTSVTSQAVQATTTGSGTITAIDAAPIIGYGAVSSTVPSANSFRELDVTGYSAAGITVTGTWTGNLSFEGTADGTNWFTTNSITPGIAGRSYFASAPKFSRLNVAGFKKIRVRAPLTAVSAVTSVTVAIFATASSALSDSMEPAMVGGGANNGGTLTGQPIPIGGIDGAKIAIPAVHSGALTVMQPGEAAAVGAAGTSAGAIRGKVTTSALGEVAVRATAYTERTVGTQWSVKSTSASDASAGTGARTIRVTYFTLTAGVIAGPFTEDVTLNGTTAVNFVATNLCYLERVDILTVGSNLVSVGTINLFDATAGGGTNFASLGIGERSTFYAHHYVPTGVKCLITDAYCCTDPTSSNMPIFSARWRDPTASANAERNFIDALGAQGSSGLKFVMYGTPRTVTGPAVVVCYVSPSNTATQISRIEMSYHEQ